MTQAHIFQRYRTALLAATSALQARGDLPGELDMTKVTVEPPRDPGHGDLSSNIGMVLAKPARLPPRAIAEKVADELTKDAGLGVAGRPSIDGPGFLNLRLTPAVWQEELSTILRAGLNWGDSAFGQGRAVNVEYVSANPTGPMHVGHARGAVVGDVLASVLAKAGFAVTREYYINDAGAQVDQLARSLHWRYREALGEDLGPIAEGLYPGEYLKSVATDLLARDGDRWLGEESYWLVPLRGFAVDAMMALIRDDLLAVGIKHDRFSSERALVEGGMIEAALKTLEERELIYVGVLEPPKGKPVEDWEPRPQTLFRSTRFGDDVDRPLKKSDGSWTYFAADIAYHFDKVRRGTPELIDVLGVDHGGYVKRMQAAVAALTDGAGRLDVRLCALVNLFDDGVSVKMSKRAGRFVTLRDVVDEVGKGVVRFIMLTRKNDAPLDFDLKKVTEQSRDNPVFYVQYAHARAASVLRHPDAARVVGTLEMGGWGVKDLYPLTDPEELGLIRLLASWPRLIESAAEAREPHRIAFYLGELAAGFHALWNKGRDDATMRFILEDQVELTKARLALVSAVKSTIASGLNVMGVEPVDEMR